MSEEVRSPGTYRRASPWPVFVALGFALSELGVFVGLYPVAVGGLLLLAGSVAGVLRESGYATDVWRPLAGLGGVFLVLGGVIVVTQVDPTVADILTVVEDPNGVVGRGLAVAGAGVTLVVLGLVGVLLE
ncbi:MAG: cox cluster protein [Halorhabdus sp.]